MARRRKDRDAQPSGKAAGGIRSSALTRGVSRAISNSRRFSEALDPLEAIGGSFRVPDWSGYGDTFDEPAAAPARRDAQGDSPRRLGQGKASRLAAIAKREARAPAPLARPVGAALSRKHGFAAGSLAKGSTLASRTLPAASKARKPVVSHAEHSPKAREEKARAHCKPRPREQSDQADRRRGRGGGGGSRDFVPWCEARR